MTVTHYLLSSSPRSISLFPDSHILNTEPKKKVRTCQRCETPYSIHHGLGIQHDHLRPATKQAPSSGSFDLPCSFDAAHGKLRYAIPARRMAVLVVVIVLRDAVLKAPFAHRDHLLQRRPSHAAVGHPTLLSATAGRLGRRVEEVEHLADAWKRARDQPNGELDLGQERNPHVVICRVV